MDVVPPSYTKAKMAERSLIKQQKKAKEKDEERKKQEEIRLEDEEKLMKAYVQQLAACNAEADTLAMTLEAFKQGFINKKDLKALTLLDSKVSIVERRRVLLKHASTSLKEKLLVIAKRVPELEIEALAVQMLREKFIKKNVFNHLASLHSEIPNSMRYRYLLQSVHQSFHAKLEAFKQRAINIVLFKLIHGFDPFKFAKEAEKDGLIEKSVLDYHISLYPEVPRVSRHTSSSWNTRQTFEHCVKEEVLQLESLANEALIIMNPTGIVSRLATDSLITPDQLSKLNEFLVNYAYNWKNIGIALNFQLQDLQNIQTSPLLLLDAPKSYLARLLEDWLLKKLGHTLPPRIDCLKRALSSKVVGLGSLVDEVEKIVCNRSLSASKLSYCLINAELCLPKNYAIYIEEGLATLIEIQHPAGGNTYQWLRNGVELTQDSSTESILCLHQADIDWDGCELSCQIKPMARTVAPIVTVNVSCELDQFRNSLASMYLAQPEVPEDTWPPTSNLKYINLAIVEQQKVNFNSEYAQLTIRGDLDDILQAKQIVSYNEKFFFDNLSSGNLILIEGRPGSGKTTFVHSLTKDWAIKSGGVIRLLLIVSLRVLNALNNPDLSDILKLFNDLQVSRHTIEQRSGKGVCFIFDGFDEFLPQEGSSSIVHKIINKTYLHQSIVVVASRPAAVAKLRHKANTVIEVVGFLNEQIFEYFNHYPFSTAAKFAELKSCLQLHPNVLHMCYLPIHATMVAYLFQEMGKVPTTETEIYTHFTRLTLIRNLTKNSEFEPVDIDLQSLTEDRRFKHICLLAFKKTLSNKQVLDQSEVNLKGTIDTSLGLITADHTAGLYGYKNIYTFVHLTFQEYLAAYHITTLSDEEQMMLIQEHGDKNHMLAVWKFYCGLIRIKASENKFKSILHISEGNILFQIQCGYETQQTTACAGFLKWVDYQLVLTDKYLSTADYTALGYVLNSTMLPTKLCLLNCNMNVEAIDALLSEMENTARDSIQSLHIIATSFDESQIECTIKLLSAFKLLRSLSLEAKEATNIDSSTEGFSNELCKLAELSLINIDTPLLSGSSFTNLFSIRFKGSLIRFRLLFNYMQHCKHLKRVNVRDNDIADEGAEVLARSLEDCLCLKELNVSTNNIGDKGACALAQSLKNCSSLKELDISSNSVGDEGAGALAESLKYCSKLEELDISSNSFGDEGACALARSLKNCKYLKELNLSGNNIGDKGASALADSLKDCNSLERIDIAGTSIQSSEVAAIFESVRQVKTMTEVPYNMHKPRLSQNQQLPHSLFSNSSLRTLTLKNLNHSTLVEGLRLGLEQHPDIQTLELSNNGVTVESIEILARYSSLKELQIHSSQIGNYGVVILSSKLQHCPNLQKLSLTSNNISSFGCSALASAANLDYCTCLEILDLADNNIRNVGALVIMSSMRHCKHFQKLNLLNNPCSITVDSNISFLVLLP